MRRSPRARRLAFRLPPYDTPRVAPRNNPKFHVDRQRAAGGVCEQTKTALGKINRIATCRPCLAEILPDVLTGSGINTACLSPSQQGHSSASSACPVQEGEADQAMHALNCTKWRPHVHIEAHNS